MRDRRHIPLPALLMLVVVSLVVTPVVAMASSGLPATITMKPAAAGPGSTVEVTGIDFPGDQLVEVLLFTSAGSSDLAVIMASDEGYFRSFVTLPSDTPAGLWEMRASALDGTTASHAFDAASAPTVDAAGAVTLSAEASLAGRSGNSSTDIMVMLVLAVLLAAVGGAAAYAWREVHSEGRQPGMGAGDDPIWSFAGGSVMTNESVVMVEEDPDRSAPSQET